MSDPRYERGFAFRRGAAVDQLVVARPRHADSIMQRHRELFGVSEDEDAA